MGEARSGMTTGDLIETLGWSRSKLSRAVRDDAMRPVSGGGAVPFEWTGDVDVIAGRAMDNIHHDSAWLISFLQAKVSEAIYQHDWGEETDGQTVMVRFNVQVASFDEALEAGTDPNTMTVVIQHEKENT